MEKSLNQAAIAKARPGLQKEVRRRLMLKARSNVSKNSAEQSTLRKAAMLSKVVIMKICEPFEKPILDSITPKLDARFIEFLTPDKKVTKLNPETYLVRPRFLANEWKTFEKLCRAPFFDIFLLTPNDAARQTFLAPDD